jgi:hypothetical protein
VFLVTETRTMAFQQPNDTKVTLSNRIVQRGPTPTINHTHIRAVVQQKLYCFYSALTRCYMQRCPDHTHMFTHTMGESSSDTSIQLACDRSPAR